MTYRFNHLFYLFAIFTYTKFNILHRQTVRGIRDEIAPVKCIVEVRSPTL